MMSKVSLTVLLLVFLSSFSFGQSNNKQDSKTDTASGCGITVSMLEAIHYEAGEKGLIFIISRLGKKEKEKAHNIRLNAARTYIMKGGNRASETIITAKGGNVDGLGRLEIYICNNLIGVIKMSKNSGLIINCYPD